MKPLQVSGLDFEAPHNPGASRFKATAGRELTRSPAVGRLAPGSLALMGAESRDALPVPCPPTQPRYSQGKMLVTSVLLLHSPRQQWGPWGVASGHSCICPCGLFPGLGLSLLELSPGPGERGCEESVLCSCPGPSVGSPPLPQVRYMSLVALFWVGRCDSPVRCIPKSPVTLAI